MARHYCDYAPHDDVHRDYHASHYGFPIDDESQLFTRLAMEIMQAGLNWGLILKRAPALITAFEGFDVDIVAAYGPSDQGRLLQDETIIRNRLKIDAIIHNAAIIKAMRESHNGFAGWLRANHPLTKPEWVKLFKKQFRFTGGEITGEFLMSIGYLPGAHRHDCPIAKLIDQTRPPWQELGQNFYDQ